MPTLKVTKQFDFEAAHFLTKYHGKCERLHGHSYKLFVTVEGPLQENGMVIDFVILKKIVKERIIEKFDHQSLNDFFENPTAENVVVWIWNELEDLSTLLQAEKDNPNLPEDIKKLLRDRENASKEVSTDVRLHEIELFETETSSVKYNG